MRAAEIRSLLKAKAIFLDIRPNAQIISNINRIVSAYRNEVGIRSYLSQMLGPMANKPASGAQFYDQDGTEMFFEAKEGETLQRLLRRVEPLPFRVIANGQERYL